MSNQGSSSDNANYKDGTSLTLEPQQPSSGEHASCSLPQRTFAKIIGQDETQVSAEQAQAQFAKTAQAAVVTGDVESLPASPDHLDYILSNMKREGFMHSSASSPEPLKDTNTYKKKAVNASQLDQVIGSWYYDLEQGGFAIDSTMAAILGIINFSGFLDADFIFQFFDQVKREHIKHCLLYPELGDLLFRNVIITKGTNFGKRFTFQGQILSRNSQGRATKAVGSFAYESSPYAEFLTREIANDALFIWDRQLQSIISNTAFHQLLEQNEEQCPSTLQELMALIHPDDNDILSLQGHILSYPQYGDSYECCVRFKRSDQKYIWVTVRTLVTERNADGKATRLFGAITNIDLLQENFDNLKLLMFTDPLTGLHNRTYFHQNQLRYEDPKLSPVSLIFLDVSALKLTNDILGHNYGDFLLLKAGQLLQNALQVTLTELNADAELVNTLITKRTALSNQTKRLGATLGNQEGLFTDFDHQPLLDIDERQQQVNGNMGLDHSSRGGKLERQVMGDAHTGAMLCDDMSDTSDSAGANANTNSGTSGTSSDSAKAGQDTQIGITPLEIAKITPDKVSMMQSKGTKALDCLDSPEGCLLQDSDINSKDRAILELPSDFFNELGSLGVTTVSMSTGSNSNSNKDTTGDEDSAGTSKDADPITQAAMAAASTEAATANHTDPSAANADNEQNSAAHADSTDSESESSANSATVAAAAAAATAAAVTLTPASTQPPGQNLNHDNDHKPTLDTLKQELNEELLNKQELKYPPEILRMGGDEFIVLFPNCDENKIKRLYQNIFKIRDMLIKNQEACPIEQRSVPICFGIGYATVGETDTRNDDFLQAMQRADYRMQANKEKYHDQHYELLQKFFEEKLHRRVSMRDERRMQILSQKERTKLRQHLES